MDNIKAYVHEQVAWINFMEKEILDKVRGIIAKQQLSEIAAGEAIIELVTACIDACEPINEEWLSAPDAVAVCPNRLIIPAFIPPADPVIERLEDNTLGDKQMEVVKEWLNGLVQKDHVLYEDLDSFLHHLCTSSCGAQSSCATLLYTADGVMKASHSSMSLPVNWRRHADVFINTILETFAVPGSCSYTGDLQSAHVLKKLKEFYISSPAVPVSLIIDEFSDQEPNDEESIDVSKAQQGEAKEEIVETVIL